MHAFCGAVSIAKVYSFSNSCLVKRHPPPQKKIIIIIIMIINKLMVL